jgi:hypothetical protein
MQVTRSSPARWLVVGLILTVVVLLFLPPHKRVRWVGSTELEIEFTVADATTNVPIAGATIQVHSAGGFYAERDPQDFALITDKAGHAKRLCKDCMCYGTSGWNIYTFFVHLPWWFYRVSARGYAGSELTALDIGENVRRVQRGKPAARLVVPIRLEKLPANPGHARDGSGRQRAFDRPAATECLAAALEPTR